MDTTLSDVFWSCQVGSKAPPFTLPATDGLATENVSLEGYRGRWLMLLFYPRDFTFVCPTELTAFSAEIQTFDKRDCSILAVSTDTIEMHNQWLNASADKGGLGMLNFPLASDEGGEVSAAYGIYMNKEGVAGRGLFLIDPDGVLQYQTVHNLSVGRSTSETLRVLDALKEGGLCGSNWTRGDGTIDPAMNLHLGTILGHYRISLKLGEGGFGQVYSAWDLDLHRLVALKVIKPGRRLERKVLLDEARAAAGLNHPNVCAIHAVEELEGLPVISMEYVQGRPLDLLLTDGAMPVHQARRIARQIARGLAASHAKGIVHGDLKPRNILVTGNSLVKILDFGIARKISPDEPLDSKTKVVRGTPAYMAPETLHGTSLTPAADVFVVGLLISEMCTGERVVAGKTPEQAVKNLQRIKPKTFSTKVPEPFAKIVEMALQPKAEKRPTMAWIADMLQGR